MSRELPYWFADVLAKHARVAIVGGPKTGKSNLANMVTDRPVIHTDDYRNMPWEAVPHAVIGAASGDRFVVEGVQAARALRKGLQVDAVVRLDKPHVPLSRGQSSMTLAVETVMRDWQEKAKPEIPIIQGGPWQPR